MIRDLSIEWTKGLEEIIRPYITKFLIKDPAHACVVYVYTGNILSSYIYLHFPNEDELLLFLLKVRIHNKIPRPGLYSF